MPVLSRRAVAALAVSLGLLGVLGFGVQSRAATDDNNVVQALRATHRMKSPRSVPAPLRQWPPNNPTFREYEELKRQGWYKEDKA